MKSETNRGAFSPIALYIETPFEYDCIMLALRIGADGLRKTVVPESANHDAAACVDFARSLLENPEVKR